MARSQGGKNESRSEMNVLALHKRQVNSRVVLDERARAAKVLPKQHCSAVSRKKGARWRNGSHKSFMAMKRLLRRSDDDQEEQVFRDELVLQESSVRLLPHVRSDAPESPQSSSGCCDARRTYAPSEPSSPLSRSAATPQVSAIV